MKKFVFFFPAFLLLILLASCPTEITPELKTDVVKDNNGHITQITYYSNDGSVYKTEYFQFLNKKTNNNAIIKIVQSPSTPEPENIILKRYDKSSDESGNTVYEIRECWKIAYALECNTYEIVGTMSILGEDIEKYYEISDENEIIAMLRNSSKYSYYIEKQAYSSNNDSDSYIPISYNFNNQTYDTIPQKITSNSYTYQLVE